MLRRAITQSTAAVRVVAVVPGDDVDDVLSVGSCSGGASPQICRYLIGGDHAAGLNVVEPGPEILDEVGIGQDVDGLPQPVEFAGGHDVGHVLAVCDDCDGFPSLCAAHGVLPHRGLLTGRVQVIGGDADRLLTHVFQDTPGSVLITGTGRAWVASR